MATTIKKSRKTRLQKLLKTAEMERPKNPSAFFGKLKDGVDGLSHQKKLRNEWR